MIAELAAAFGRRLHEAGLPVTPERSARFADALSLTEPVARTRLYWVARAVFVSDHAQVKAFDRVFFEIFGGETFTYDAPPDEVHELAVADDRPASANAAGGAPGGASPAPGDGESSDDAVSVVPVMASAEERLRDKHFDALEPAELAALYRLMSELEVAAPIRRTRRAKRDRRGAHIDLRRTLRGSLRTGGDPIHLARRDRREVAAEDRPAVRHQRLDGAVRPRVPAVPHVRGPGRRGVRVRHPPHAHHPRAGHALAGAGDPARRRGGPGLVVRHADRRRAQGLQRPPRPTRDGARRGDRDPQRRLGARRPGARRAGDGAAGAARVPDRVGEPARGGLRLRAAGRRDGGGAPAHRRARLRPHAGRDARGHPRDRRRAHAQADGARRAKTRNGRAPHRWPAAASPCPADTARAEEGRRPDGFSIDEAARRCPSRGRITCRHLHLPGVRPSRSCPRPRPAARRRRSATAKTTTRSPRTRSASDWRKKVADEAYRAVFLRVHPTGQDGAQPHDPRRRQRARLRAARGRRARRARAGREGRARGREPLRLRPRVQRGAVARHARGDHRRDGQDPGQGQAARRASTSARTTWSGPTARS